MLFSRKEPRTSCILSVCENGLECLLLVKYLCRKIPHFRNVHFLHLACVTTICISQWGGQEAGLGVFQPRAEKGCGAKTESLKANQGICSLWDCLHLAWLTPLGDNRHQWSCPNWTVGVLMWRQALLSTPGAMWVSPANCKQSLTFLSFQNVTIDMGVSLTLGGPNIISCAKIYRMHRNSLAIEQQGRASIYVPHCDWSN